MGENAATGLQSYQAVSSLTAGIDGSTVTVPVANQVFNAAGKSVPTDVYVRIDDEWMRIDSAVANDLTVLRGALGSSPASHSSGDMVAALTHPLLWNNMAEASNNLLAITPDRAVTYMDAGEMAGSANFLFASSEAMVLLAAGSVNGFHADMTEAIGSSVTTNKVGFLADGAITIAGGINENGERIGFKADMKRETVDGYVDVQEGFHASMGLGTGSTGRLDEVYGLRIRINWDGGLTSSVDEIWGTNLLLQCNNPGIAGDVIGNKTYISSNSATAVTEAVYGDVISLFNLSGEMEDMTGSDITVENRSDCVGDVIGSKIWVENNGDMSGGDGEVWGLDIDAVLDLGGTGNQQLIGAILRTESVAAAGAPIDYTKGIWNRTVVAPGGLAPIFGIENTLLLNDLDATAGLAIALLSAVGSVGAGSAAEVVAVRGISDNSHIGGIATGTVVFQAAGEFRFGYNAAGVGGHSIATTDAYGIKVQYANEVNGGGSSVITNAYQIHLSEAIATPGTTTNKWGIFQANTGAPNRFLSPLQAESHDHWNGAVLTPGLDEVIDTGYVAIESKGGVTTAMAPVEPPYWGMIGATADDFTSDIPWTALTFTGFTVGAEADNDNMRVLADITIPRAGLWSIAMSIGGVISGNANADITLGLRAIRTGDSLVLVAGQSHQNGAISEPTYTSAAIEFTLDASDVINFEINLIKTGSGGDATLTDPEFRISMRFISDYVVQ